MIPVRRVTCQAGPGFLTGPGLDPGTGSRSPSQDSSLTELRRRVEFWDFQGRALKKRGLRGGGSRKLHGSETEGWSLHAQAKTPCRL